MTTSMVATVIRPFVCLWRSLIDVLTESVIKEDLMKSAFDKQNLLRVRVFKKIQFLNRIFEFAVQHNFHCTASP